MPYMGPYLGEFRASATRMQPEAPGAPGAGGRWRSLARGGRWRGAGGRWRGAGGLCRTPASQQPLTDDSPIGE